MQRWPTSLFKRKRNNQKRNKFPLLNEDANGVPPKPALTLCPEQEHAGPIKEGKGLNQKRAIGPSHQGPEKGRSACTVTDPDEGFIKSART